MITLTSLLKKLALNELSNLSISETGTIASVAHPKIVSYLNEGLTDLFSKFSLKEGIVKITQIENLTQYPLRPEFAKNSGSSEIYKFIYDTPTKKFPDDVLKILTVNDAQGNERVLNDQENPWSLYTPMPDTLQIPWPIKDQGLMVGYQANHTVIADSGTDYLNQKIYIPRFLEQPLRSFIASRVYNDMNGQENILNSQKHEARYEKKCLEIEAKDLVNNSNTSVNTKLWKRGFI